VGAVVDVAAGDGTLRGYVFALTSKGRVMVTTGAVSGWTEYGQGAPTKPSSAAYVALASGHGALAGCVYALRADGPC